MVSQEGIATCRLELEELAKAGERLAYGGLMDCLGVERSKDGARSLKEYLDPIYEEEMEAGRPDITLILHKAGSLFGQYHSGGARARSVKVDPNNQEQIENYKAELRKVYQEWGGHPKGDLKKWLDS